MGNTSINDIDAAFKANTTITKNKYGWNVDCNKGNFGVSCKSKKQCLSEARWYFLQYLCDGEYDNDEGMSKFLENRKQYPERYPT